MAEPPLDDGLAVKTAKQFLRDNKKVVKRHWSDEQTIKEAKDLREMIAAGMSSNQAALHIAAD